MHDNDMTTEYRTCEKILEDEIYNLIDLGFEHGLLSEDIDRILQKILKDKAERYRRKFKVI